MAPKKSADSGYFSHTRHSLQLITQMPVLQSAQVSEAVFVAAVYECVFVNPPGTGGIGPDCGVDSFGQTAGDLLHLFHHSCTCPVYLRPIFQPYEHSLT